MKIVTIDNNTAALSEMSECIRDAYPDSEVLSFADPLLAVKYGYNNHVDMVFTAVEMKGLTGFDVLRLLRGKLNARLSIVFVADGDEFISDTQKLIATGYIQKPVTAGKVRALCLMETGADVI